MTTRLRASFGAIAGAALLGAWLILSPSNAVAKEQGLPLFELGIGGALYHNPSYPGSDVRTTTGFPFLYVIYRGDWLRIDRSLQGILYETRRIKADFSAGSTSLVESDDSDARAGMPDLDRTFDVGPALSLLLSDPNKTDSLWSRLALRTAITIHDNVYTSSDLDSKVIEA